MTTATFHGILAVFLLTVSLFATIGKELHHLPLRGEALQNTRTAYRIYNCISTLIRQLFANYWNTGQIINLPLRKNWKTTSLRSHYPFHKL